MRGGETLNEANVWDYIVKGKCDPIAVGPSHRGLLVLLRSGVVSLCQDFSFQHPASQLRPALLVPTNINGLDTHT